METRMRNKIIVRGELKARRTQVLWLSLGLNIDLRLTDRDNNAT
jgi:hypothetical protein